MKKVVIYKIENLLNAKIYIGSTIDFDRRKKDHIRDLNNNKHHSAKLQRSWNKYGENNFKFEIIEEVIDRNLLLEREQYYFDLLNPCDNNIGYNIYKTAANNFDYSLSMDTREKMRISHTGIKTGKRSDEARLNMKNAQLNKDSTESAQKRIKTLLAKDENIFNIIGKKSSETQKRNRLHVGSKNYNYIDTDLLIFNEKDEIVFITKNLDFKELCRINNLPHRVLNKSKFSDGEYKLYQNSPPTNIENLKFKGWYCKYKK